MATILLSDPNELLANRGQANRGLSKHDDDRAADIQHTWYSPLLVVSYCSIYQERVNRLRDLAILIIPAVGRWRAHNMDKLRAAQGQADLAGGALTSVGAWLMVVGEEVREGYGRNFPRRRDIPITVDTLLCCS